MNKFTTVWHPGRIELGLNMLEYGVADSIYHLSNNPERPGYCYAKKQVLSDFFGISRQGLAKIINKLIDKKILIKNDSGHLKTTELWYQTIIVSCKQSSHDVNKVDAHVNKVSIDVNKVDAQCKQSGLSSNDIDINKDINNNINKDSTPEKPGGCKIKGLHHDCVKVFNDLFYQKNGIAFPFKYGKIDSKMINNILELMKITKVEEFKAIVTVAINHTFWGGKKLNPTVIYNHIQEFIPGGKQDVLKNNFSQGARNQGISGGFKYPTGRKYGEMPKVPGNG